MSEYRDGIKYVSEEEQENVLSIDTLSKYVYVSELIW